MGYIILNIEQGILNVDFLPKAFSKGVLRDLRKK